MEMGADLFHAVVNWVVIFEPLVKKIGCDDKEMWDAYLLVSGSSNFSFALAGNLQGLVKMMQFCVTPL